MVVNKRRDELQHICRTCKKPTRFPGCQDHCKIGKELKAITSKERDERNERNKIINENRSYIRDAIQRKVKK